MNLKTRLQRLERIGVPRLVVRGPTVSDRLDQLAQEDFAREQAYRTELAAALSCGDADRAAWAKEAADRLARFDALSEREQQTLVLGQLLDDYRAGRLDDRRFAWARA